MVEGGGSGQYEDIEALRRELDSIKLDMMRREFEDIKNESVRRELEEVRADRIRVTSDMLPMVPIEYVTPAPALSIPTLISACLTLIIAGYLLGSVSGFNVTGEVSRIVAGYGLPLDGASIVMAIVVLLALIGAGLVIMTKR